MSDDKHKNIPILEDVVQPGGVKPTSKSLKSANKTDNNKATSAKSKAKLDTGDRRQSDRRKKQQDIPEGKTERRAAERRKDTRRSTDQRRNQELDHLVEKIMGDLMPDLEQHLFMQLRFELQKYIPQTLSEFKDKDKE